MLNTDGSAWWNAQFRDLGHLPTFHPDRSPQVLGSYTGRESQVRDRSDRCQCFTPETQCGDLKKIISMAKFAGRVAVDSQLKFIERYTGAIINDLYQPFAGIANHDLDLAYQMVDLLRRPARFQSTP